MHFVKTRLYRLLRSWWFPWFILCAAAISLMIEGVFISDKRNIAQSLPAIFWIIAAGIASLLAVLVDRIQEMRKRIDNAERLVRAAENKIEMDHARLRAIFQISQRFVSAVDEHEIVESVLPLAAEVSAAEGASYVGLDEQGQAAFSFRHGEIPAAESWLEYLASPDVRRQCSQCRRQGVLVDICPLASLNSREDRRIFCLPVRKGDKDFGVINLYLVDGTPPDQSSRDFLGSLADITAIALEAVRLRQKAQASLQAMQSIRVKKDVPSLAHLLLENVHQALEADFSVLWDQSGLLNQETVQQVQGVIPSSSFGLLESLKERVAASGEPLLIGEISTGEGGASPLSLMISPLFTPEGRQRGVLLVGNSRGRGFQPRQLAILHSLAGQAALILQNAEFEAELEYRLMFEERARLAREIHDGLAQTLGFLKLQAAQMENFLAQNDLDSLRRSIKTSYAALSEAYQDARQAIDGLRLWPSESGIDGWLPRIAQDFEELSGIPVNLEIQEPVVNLPTEIQAQLIRIVQEALSNIRKHAKASHTWIFAGAERGELVLEIKDDGVGFAPQDVSFPSKHGLRGMQERADLIGAEFQIISRPGDGTLVRLLVPLLLTLERPPD